MSKKDFIALADAIKAVNSRSGYCNEESMKRFLPGQLEVLADFCKSQNPAFMRDRWLDYIAGKCGKNGGKIAA